MAFEIAYHIVTVARISLRARDVFAVIPFTKYRLRLAGTSFVRITADLRERRGAGDIRCGTQYSIADILDECCRLLRSRTNLRSAARSAL